MILRNILPFIYIAVAVGLYFSYIGPTYGNVQELREEEAKFTEALAQAEEFRALLAGRQATYNTFAAADIDRLDYVLPADFDSVDYVRTIDSIASTHNLRIRDVEMDSTPQTSAIETEDTSTYQTFSLTFSVVGSYERMLAFMEDVEKSIQLTDVVEMEIETLTGGQQLFTINLRTYWFAAPQEA